MRFLVKIIITALVVAGVSELAKRYSALGAILASLPLTSVLAMIWLYWDTKSNAKIISLSYGIFWAVLPSLAFFLILPALLNAGLKFAYAMPIACGLMALLYFVYLYILKQFGVEVL